MESLTEQLAEAFIACTLPKAAWTHQAHLRVGLWHLLHASPPEALAQLRQRISRYNIACGIENTASQRYHETITQFYVWLIDQFLQHADRSQSIDQLAEQLIDRFGDPSFPFRYYSRDRLMSKAARLEWVDPNLQPLASFLNLSITPVG